MHVVQHPDPDHMPLLEEAARVLALPVEASRFHWHPFGVFAIPLAPREVDGVRWSRRLHVWHPAAEPVGEASPYGVHTHSGTARSHVLAGTLHHHLYAFRPDEEGAWRAASTASGFVPYPASLLWHHQAPTRAGHVHTLPADHPHGVTKDPGIALSLFEQAQEKEGRPFATWQRTDVDAEPLVTTPPVPLGDALREARATVERSLYTAAGRS